MNHPQFLTKSECSAMRAFAILAIIMHNYCHWLAPAVKENEYVFDIGNSQLFLGKLAAGGDFLLVNILSYWGHYGVPVFLFLSGYGLVVKYEQMGGSDAAWSPWLFLRRNYYKLFKMMAIGFAFFVVIDALTPGRWHYAPENIVAQLLMVINLLPHPNQVIWPGPYWFFGLMMQLYAIYAFLLHGRKSWVVIALILVCHVAQSLCDETGDTLKWLRYNSIGSVLPFGVGILLARHFNETIVSWLGADKRRWIWPVMVIISAHLLIEMCCNFHLWMVMPLLVIVFAVAIVKCIPAAIMPPLVWMGGVSAAVFVIHPAIRKLLIRLYGHGDELYGGLLLYIVATIIISYMVSRFIRKQNS